MNEYRKPAAFMLDDEPKKPRQKTRIEFDVAPEKAELVTVPEVPRRTSRRMRWGSVLVSALAALLALWVGLAATRLVEDFFARSPILGWVALAVAATAGFAALAIVMREIWGLARLNRIEHIQETAARALNMDDATAAKSTISGLDALYAGRPAMRWHLDRFRQHRDDIMDPRDRVALFDRHVLRPLDEEAHRVIARRARRVTLLTTVTPVAALDIVFVAAQNLVMLRELAELYGGRPSTLSTLKLARMVAGHLAVTGGLALSDNLLQHVVGKGLLGRLSARFGEGAVNGIMTSRIGLAAQDVCRPIPQPGSRKDNLSSLLREVMSFGAKSGEDPPPTQD
jgi:putative membrane protein